ncbi:MAG: hypothetical protein VB021_04950 [Oscillospiraceae bacterium]|nr:hypothetical protein [Oscillospiraceae bacterium]
MKKKDSSATEKRKKPQARDILGWILFITLVGSIAFAVVMVVRAPEDGVAVQQGQRLKSDYVLMLAQCLLGLVVMFLPSLLERKFKITVPNYMCAMYFVFLYCAIYLGEVRSFFYVFKNWDTLLHGFSAMMLGTLGFSLVTILNDSDRVMVDLSPLFVGLFAFCFAIAVGVVWEIYEFSFDGLLGMNMQKFRLEDGTLLVGRAALADTMEDLIVDACGALVVSVVGALSIRRRREAPETPPAQGKKPLPSKKHS